jgi:phage terminase small subunit
MPSLKNARHERFAQHLAQGKSAVEAYRLAGYRAANKSAETAGPRLFRNVHKQRVVELQQKVARKAEITLESLLEEAELQRAAALGAEQYAAANGAARGAGRSIAARSITLQASVPALLALEPNSG